MHNPPGDSRAARIGEDRLAVLEDIDEHCIIRFRGKDAETGGVTGGVDGFVRAQYVGGRVRLDLRFESEFLFATGGINRLEFECLVDGCWRKFDFANAICVAWV